MLDRDTIFVIYLFIYFCELHTVMVAFISEGKSGENHSEKLSEKKASEIHC